MLSKRWLSLEIFCARAAPCNRARSHEPREHHAPPNSSTLDRALSRTAPDSLEKFPALQPVRLARQRIWIDPASRGDHRAKRHGSPHVRSRRRGRPTGHRVVSGDDVGAAVQYVFLRAKRVIDVVARNRACSVVGHPTPPFASPITAKPRLEALGARKARWTSRGWSSKSASLVCTS